VQHFCVFVVGGVVFRCCCQPYGSQNTELLWTRIKQ